MRTLLPIALAACLGASSASAQCNTTTYLRHLSTVDVSTACTAGAPKYIGTNPSGVAWNGQHLFVAGFNNGGLTDAVAIVEVTNALSGGAATYGVHFGVQPATPSLRGYSGLDIDNGTVLAAYDFGATHPGGLAAYQFDGNAKWAYPMRGSSGVAHDPGFGGVDHGAAWTTFGSGRRMLNEQSNGLPIYTSTDGMIINGAGTGTYWRDMDFDDDTGDIWLREGNNLISAARTGGNSNAGAVLVVDEPEADFVAGQNVAYMHVPVLGDRVIYNDRQSTAGSQDFFVVNKVCAPDGTPHTIDWGTFTPINHPAGNAYYDYSWHAASRKLAILDFGERAVYLFELVIDPSCPINYCTAGVSSNGCQATMSFTGMPSASKSSAFTVDALGVEGEKAAIIFYGLAPHGAPIGGGNTSYLCVKAPLQRTPLQFSAGTAGQCDGVISLDWNAWMTTHANALGAPYLAGNTYYAQCWYRDPPAPKTTNTSDGLAFTLAP